MTIDKTTLNDLSFFKGEHSIFSLLNRCATQAGSDVLRQYVQQPPTSLALLRERQAAVAFWMKHGEEWTETISNGTIVMIEKYYESADTLSSKPGAVTLFLDSLTQKLLNRDQYSFIRFSISHLVAFFKGCQELTGLLKHQPPVAVRSELELMEKALQLPLCTKLAQTDPEAPQKVLLSLSYHARREIKNTVLSLIGAYARLDALQSMAVASLEHKWTLPELLPSEQVVFDGTQLYHPLLSSPVAYDVRLAQQQNFMFLTGANMSGKSTLIRAMGITALLAHTGMGVPAQSLRISFLEGIITNMHVEDDILLGESYFFAEVKRMKVTAQKLSRSRFHLVLMDELFKGTNVHDAYECSRAVIEGLLQQKDNMMVLSTHLYELSEELSGRPSIAFRYCYTRMEDGAKYHFTYQLREGVSNDRIGYLVLKNEGVLELLKGGS